MIAHRVELTDEAETEDNHTKRHQTTLTPTPTEERQPATSTGPTTKQNKSDRHGKD
jgi:hypothetical protein